MISDLTYIVQWWFVFFAIGIIFLPTTSIIFSSFINRGYIFSKILGIAFISYAIFILGIFKILPFTLPTIFLTIGLFTVVNIFIIKKCWDSTMKQFNNETIRIFLFEEFLFFTSLAFWSYIRGFQPDIHGLEKYMDYGFINSILRSEHFPPHDMWFTPLSINYYYFGHLVTAVLTKASLIPTNITYNLMLATIFAFTFTGSFSIGANLINKLKTQNSKFKTTNQNLKVLIIGGLLTAFLTTFAGNLHAIYTFFKPYPNENPVPFWQLALSFDTFPNSYWYPNATRFIQNTIHEFPMYSFVVSDLHGHVLDIPFVLLTIALLLSLIQNSIPIKSGQKYNSKFKSLLEIGNWKLEIPLLSFLIAVMYMTNAWDGIIYFLLTTLVIIYLNWKRYFHIGLFVVLVCIGSILFSLPFSLNFKPFVSGIGVLCAPNFLTDIGKLGPFLFEKDHCQHSPWWQLLILYGFFYFWGISFLVFIFKKLKIINLGLIKNLKLKIKNLEINDIFILILIFLSTLLLIIPELIYAKDIYPAHYRANTMFKLGYQAFIMLSISSGYIIVRLFVNLKSSIINRKSYLLFVYLFIGSICLLVVFVYPYFATTSYYGNLQTYYGLDGTAYLKKLYPTDYEAITWINKNIKGQPVILEAQGDSYTDYARISTHTGLPTILGWMVHEWLWRGSYDIPSPRIEEVKTLYETNDMVKTEQLLKKHQVSYVFVGNLERQKYPNLSEEKFKSISKIIYQNGQTKIYQLK